MKQRKFIATTIHESLKETHKTFIGYRNIESNIKGKYGTFYNVQKPKHYQTREVKLIFKNPLIITDKNVYNF